MLLQAAVVFTRRAEGPDGDLDTQRHLIKNLLLEDRQQTSAETEGEHFTRRNHNESFQKLAFSPWADTSECDEKRE